MLRFNKDILYYNIFAKNINRIEERAPRRFSIRLTFKTVKHKDQSTKIYFKPVAEKVEIKKPVLLIWSILSTIACFTFVNRTLHLFSN